MRAVALLAALALLVRVEPARANEDALRICLDATVPPLSSKRGEEGLGFDLAVAQAIAKRLGRRVAVQWFEVDDEGDPAEQANALLSDGRCRLVAGYPLFAEALGKPEVERSRLPDFEGAKPADRRRWVPLGQLVASRAYRFDPLVVVLGPGIAARAIGSLGDLEDVRLGAEEGTLADAILMMHGDGRLIDGIAHVTPPASASPWLAPAMARRVPALGWTSWRPCRSRPRRLAP